MFPSTLLLLLAAGPLAFAHTSPTGQHDQQLEERTLGLLFGGSGGGISCLLNPAVLLLKLNGGSSFCQSLLPTVTSSYVVQATSTTTTTLAAQTVTVLKTTATVTATSTSTSTKSTSTTALVAGSTVYSTITTSVTSAQGAATITVSPVYNPPLATARMRRERRDHQKRGSATVATPSYLRAYSASTIENACDCLDLDAPVVRVTKTAYSYVTKTSTPAVSTTTQYAVASASTTQLATVTRVQTVTQTQPAVTVKATKTETVYRPGSTSTVVAPCISGYQSLNGVCTSCELLYPGLATGAVTARKTCQYNLVANPSFEQGDASWTLSGDTSATGIAAGQAHTGDLSYAFGAASEDAVLCQKVGGLAATNYRFSFWAMGQNFDGRFAAQVTIEEVVGDATHVLYDSGALQAQLNDEYQQFSSNIASAVDAVTICYRGYNPPSYYFLDDVSLVEL